MPLIIGGLPCEPTLTIYDLDGTEQDWPWLIDTFGAVTLQRGTCAGSVATLQAIEGPTALTVLVLDGDGTPVQDMEVVFYWPGAPALEPGQEACGLDRGLVLLTKEHGKAEFSMGGGSYYWPPAAGPHTVWLVTQGTDCLGGLGMIAATNHIHLDSEWVIIPVKEW